MLSMLFIASVAFATTTQLSFDVEDGVNPVSKVTKLLTDMQKQLKADQAMDEDNYEKLSCWCETNNKDKTTAIAEYEATINELKSEIESRTKRGQRLADSIKEKNEEIANAIQSIEALEAQRKKEGTENQAKIIDLTKNIQALQGAVVVLKKHQLTAFPQMKLNFLAMKAHSKKHPQDDLDRLSSWMQDHSFQALTDESNKNIELAVKKFTVTQTNEPAHSLNSYSAEELSTLARAKKLVRAFTQTSAQPYANGSGEIFGILTQLLEEMRGDLEDLEKSEASSAAEAREMLANLATQQSEAEKMLKDKEMEAAQNVKALADAKEGIEDANTNLDADSKFLKEVIDMCGKADEQWEERKKTRGEEISAISEALAMLTSDDSRDLFTSTLGFLQMRAVSHRLSNRDRVAQLLSSAGHKAKDASLVALSTAVRLDGFTKVKKAIDEMITDLKTEQADEVKHRDWCTKELQDNDMASIAKSNEKKDLETKIDGLSMQIETLTSEIKNAKAALAETKVQLQKANMDRVEENKGFQAVIDDQRATQKLLEKVATRLNVFYGEKNALVQSHAHVKVGQPQMPGQMGDYKSNAGSGSVVAMIDNLIADAAKLEKEAITDENSAQASYEEYVSEANESMAAKAREIVNKSETKAEADTALEQANVDLQQSMDDLDALAKYASDVHKSCDFVMQNFEIRQTARGEEIEALQQAKAILSGMQ